MWKYYILIGYLVLINIIAFVAMYVDKRRAINHRRRTPEKVLFALACVLGGLGCIMGMYTFRHKTKHKTFVIGMPLIAVFTYGLLAVVLLFATGVLG